MTVPKIFMRMPPASLGVAGTRGPYRSVPRDELDEEVGLTDLMSSDVDGLFSASMPNFPTSSSSSSMTHWNVTSSSSGSESISESESSSRENSPIERSQGKASSSSVRDDDEDFSGNNAANFVHLTELIQIGADSDIDEPLSSYIQDLPLSVKKTILNLHRAHLRAENRLESAQFWAERRLNPILQRSLQDQIPAEHRHFAENTLLAEFIILNASQFLIDESN